jgi:putative Mg2+ transporter-C (MgtC) family protein
MFFDLNLQIIGKLLLAAALGGLIGLEREYRRRPAGLRTNMFLCLGSAMFTLLSVAAADRFGGDHVRIASQIIPGIGFLGAGAILRGRAGVVGLTTAATMFVVASVGMAVGAGLYVTAIFAAALILLALTFLGWLEEHYGLKTRILTFRYTAADAQRILGRTHDILDEMHVPMLRYDVRRMDDQSVLEFDAEISTPQERELANRLSGFGGHFEALTGRSGRE